MIIIIFAIHCYLYEGQKEDKNSRSAEIGNVIIVLSSRFKVA